MQQQIAEGNLPLGLLVSHGLCLASYSKKTTYSVHSVPCWPWLGFASCLVEHASSEDLHLVGKLPGAFLRIAAVVVAVAAAAAVAVAAAAD